MWGWCLRQTWRVEVVFCRGKATSRLGNATASFARLCLLPQVGEDRHALHHAGQLATEGHGLDVLAKWNEGHLLLAQQLDFAADALAAPPSSRPPANDCAMCRSPGYRPSRPRRRCHWRAARYGLLGWRCRAHDIGAVAIPAALGDRPAVGDALVQRAEVGRTSSRVIPSWRMTPAVTSQTALMRGTSAPAGITTRSPS